MSPVRSRSLAPFFSGSGARLSPDQRPNARQQPLRRAAQRLRELAARRIGRRHHRAGERAGYGGAICDSDQIKRGRVVIRTFKPAYLSGSVPTTRVAWREWRLAVAPSGAEPSNHTFGFLSASCARSGRYQKSWHLPLFFPRHEHNAHGPPSTPRLRKKRHAVLLIRNQRRSPASRGGGARGGDTPRT